MKGLGSQLEEITYHIISCNHIYLCVNYAVVMAVVVGAKDNQISGGFALHQHPRTFPIETFPLTVSRSSSSMPGGLPCVPGNQWLDREEEGRKK
jgi:hypothetical protein